MSDARERPILFSGAMVRAILEDRKKQTRRLLEDGAYKRHYHPFEGDFGEDGVPEACWKRSGCMTGVTCPYGNAGDRLWVRETWHPCDSGPVIYAADYGHSKSHAGVERWSPAIFMKRADSRIMLDVVELRVERLQEITGEDARAEGIDLPRCGCEVCLRSSTMCPGDAGDHIEHFAELWDGINGKRAPWSSNPWVWVVEFRRIKP